MSALKWGDVTTETPIDQLTAAPAANSNSDSDSSAVPSPISAPAAPASVTVSPPPPTPTAVPSASAASSSPLPSISTSAPAAVALTAAASASEGASAADVLSLSATLSSSTVSAPVGVEESKDEDDPLPLRWRGLNPGDDKAEVEVKNAGDSIYKAVASFEQLGLSPQLLAGVYELKFTSPSKIQAQALPVILSGKSSNKPGPNLIGQAHHGSGKSACLSTAACTASEAVSLVMWSAHPFPCILCALCRVGITRQQHISAHRIIDAVLPLSANSSVCNRLLSLPVALMCCCLCCAVCCLVVRLRPSHSASYHWSTRLCLSLKAVVVVPTRELALQVASVIQALAKHTAIQVYTAVPDADGTHDVAKLKAERVTAHVVVGTPGKLENKLKYRNIDSRHVKVFVADEADQMVAQEAFANTTLNIKK